MHSYCCTAELIGLQKQGCTIQQMFVYNLLRENYVVLNKVSSPNSLFYSHTTSIYSYLHGCLTPGVKGKIKHRKKWEK